MRRDEILINILICDDEKSFREILEYKIIKILENELGAEYKIKCCNSISELEMQLKAQSYDIVFLDIMVNEQNSIDWLIEKKTKLRRTQFVVMTAFPIESYKISETDSCYFLIKSKMTDAQLLSAIKKALSNVFQNQSTKKIIKSGGHNYTINIDEITYIETFNNVIVIHIISGEKYTVYSSLKSFSKELSPTFLRCHKSFMVNMNYVLRYEAYKFTLKDMSEVPISPKTYLKVVDEYRNYLLNL